ncbi:MAG TPA: preprotein translocase subunit YajC [Chitinispirillaceae bacterium]|nr:preprotein translocase subunit YajC [Chitinispirillaceae bacterium]
MKYRTFIASATFYLVNAVTVFSQGTQSTAPTGGFGSLLPMIAVMFAIIYFFMIRPEQKKQKERLEMLKNLKKGDKVLTSAGILGVVGNIKDNTVMVKIGENAVVEFTKSAITSVINENEKTVDKTEKEKK